MVFRERAADWLWRNQPPRLRAPQSNQKGYVSDQIQRPYLADGRRSMAISNVPLPGSRDNPTSSSKVIVFIDSCIHEQQHERNRCHACRVHQPKTSWVAKKCPGARKKYESAPKNGPKGPLLKAAN